MARFGVVPKSKSGKKKSLSARIKGRQNATRRPLLPKKGLTQSSYEAGFFDFLKVFWNNNSRMEICNLTKQVAKTWEALLPKPKLSKKTVLKDYREEFEALQKESEQQRRDEEAKQGKETDTDDGQKKHIRIEASSGSETAGSSRTNLDSEDTNESDRDGTENDSEDETDRTSTTLDESGSDYDSDSSRPVKRKREGRKYESYEDYLKSKKMKKEGDGTDSNRNASERKETKEQGKSSEKPKDDLFFPLREETSFDRIVKNDYHNKEEMLRKLKMHGSGKDPEFPDNEGMRPSSSVNSMLRPIGSRDDNRNVSSKLSSPTDTLHVKNLVVGIRQPELQEIFRVFLKDIVLIRVLDNKFNGEAVVQCKNVDVAQKVWRQMNGIEYKRLPLVLEFANKDDLLY